MKKSKKPPVKTNMIVPEVKTVVQPKAEPAEDMVLQFGEHVVSMAAISDKVRQSWKENGNEGELREIKIYVKPEDNKAYYVINKEIAGDVDLVEQ